MLPGDDLPVITVGPKRMQWSYGSQERCWLYKTEDVVAMYLLKGKQ